MSKKIVVVDDDADMCEMLQQDLTRRGFEVVWFLNAEKAAEHVRQAEVDVLLTDLNLPRMNGIELCRQVTGDRPDLPVVVITAFGSLESAVAAIRAGAYDFVTKPIDLDLLSIALARAIRHRELQEKVLVLSRALESRRFDEIIGESEPMQQLFSLLVRVADSDASVLVVGESGTGKELVARALHNRSHRKTQPFLAVNCSALPESLLESELFGYKRGAFTDAKSDHDGLFVTASGGTLFLDEVGDIPLPLQPKLLRALQERSIRPVGGSAEIPVDVRIIAATNRDLEAAIEEHRFRDDFYYRINVIQITVPPLRSRGTDTVLLAKHFLQQIAARSAKQVRGISETAARKLLDYHWPGNVRELRNAIERAVALTPYDVITPGDLPDKIADYNRSRIVPDSMDAAELVPLEAVEQRYIQRVLEATGGNRSQSARILGLDRKTLSRKLQGFPPHVST